MTGWRHATGAAFALAVAIPALAAALPIKALRWLAPSADRVAALTTAPVECLSVSSPAIEIGRAAFRSPLLLGGQAARAGLACDSCHRNGRSNPDFAFPGVSGAPGTADVTSSLFSRKRGDGIDNPVAIPDLAAGPRKVPSPALRGFIEGLIVEEFDGALPPPAVLDGLVAYVAAMRGATCPASVTSAVSAAGVAGEAQRAVAAARAALARGDGATAAVLLLAARGQLGALDERYAGLVREQARLRVADDRLAAALAAVRAGDPVAAAAMAQWEAALPALVSTLVAAEPRSLFSARRLQDRSG